MTTLTCTRRTSSARKLRRGACDFASTGSSVHRYYDPVSAQFVSVDPALSVTGQPYSYAGSDPANRVDSLGLSGGGFRDFCSGNSGSDRCQTTTTWGQVLVGTGIVLGVVAAATGVGAVIEVAGVASAVGAGATAAEAGSGAIGYGLAAVVSGSVATGVDGSRFGGQDQAACVGEYLGIVGVGAGILSTGGSIGGALGWIESGSWADASLQGVGAFSVMFGIGAATFDLAALRGGPQSRECRGSA